MLPVCSYLCKNVYEKKNEADISYNINKANVIKMINREKSI